jgi:acyl-CoA thioesterase FadM
LDHHCPAAEQERLFWVVRRHEIDYLDAAHLDDQIVARTSLGTASRLRFERHTEILCVPMTAECSPGRALCGVLSTRSAAIRRR